MALEAMLPVASVHVLEHLVMASSQQAPLRATELIPLDEVDPMTVRHRHPWRPEPDNEANQSF